MIAAQSHSADAAKVDVVSEGLEVRREETEKETEGVCK